MDSDRRCDSKHIYRKSISLMFCIFSIFLQTCVRHTCIKCMFFVYYVRLLCSSIFLFFFTICISTQSIPPPSPPVSLGRPRRPAPGLTVAAAVTQGGAAAHPPQTLGKRPRAPLRQRWPLGGRPQAPRRAAQRHSRAQPYTDGSSGGQYQLLL